MFNLWFIVLLLPFLRTLSELSVSDNVTLPNLPEPLKCFHLPLGFVFLGALLINFDSGPLSPSESLLVLNIIKLLHQLCLWCRLHLGARFLMFLFAHILHMILQKSFIRHKGGRATCSKNLSEIKLKELLMVPLLLELLPSGRRG